MKERLPILPTLAEFAALWPMFVILAIGLLFFAYAKYREEKVRREYLAFKKRKALQWEIDLAKERGWNEVWKEDSGFYDAEYYWRNHRN